MVRLALLIGLVTACGGSTKGPAWPKSAMTEDDGGESLAPRPGSVAVSAADDDDEDELVVEKPADKPAAKSTEDKPAETSRPTAPTVTAPEDIINTEDLVIEIDD